MSCRTKCNKTASRLHKDAFLSLMQFRTDYFMPKNGENTAEEFFEITEKQFSLQNVFLTVNFVEESSVFC